MTREKIKISADAINKVKELTDACQYWSHQKRQAQQMLELASKNLLELEAELNIFTQRTIRINGHERGERCVKCHEASPELSKICGGTDATCVNFN